MKLTRVEKWTQDKSAFAGLMPTTKEIIVDIKDKIPNNAHYVYQASVDTEGNLFVDRGVIYRQGSFHNSDPQPAVFRKAP